MSAAKLVAAIDHGTTSTRCILFARDGTPAAIAQREQTMYYPRAGWVELDMEQVWQRTQECVHEALGIAGAAAADVAAIGIANERESVVLWDRRTGRPVAASIGSASSPACPSRPTRRPSSCGGSWTRRPPAARRPSAATCSSERRTRGCCGT
jgi:glycerol kinase